MTMTSAQEAHVTIGIDLGDRVSHACVLDDPTGKVLDRMSFPTSAEGFERFRSLPPSRIVIEVGTHSPWVSRMLLAMGHEVIAANARRVGLIARSERKTDRVDAETLARLGRVDPQLLHPVRHRSAEAHSDLEVLKARDVLVRCRTTCVNHVRGALKAAGVRPPASGAECFARKVAEHVPEALRPALAPLLAHLDGLTEQIRAYDRAVRKLCEGKYVVTEGLRQVPGVGPITSLAFVLTLDDPARFRRSRMVGAYLGLCPRSSQSGDSDPQLRITKAGNSFLRRLLVGSAHYILGPFAPDSTLRRFGMEIMARGGGNARKRAIVAVARKLAVLLHRLWLSADRYDPLRDARPVRQPA